VAESDIANPGSGGKNRTFRFTGDFEKFGEAIET